MLELRWLDREAINLHPATNIYPQRPRETVLQYRLLVDVTQSTALSTVTQVTRIPETKKEWSPWMDVPTVKEKLSIAELQRRAHGL